jgi:CBS domain-containing protein
MKVKEIMTRNPTVCTEDSTLQEVARTMVGCDCGAVPVVRDNALSGMVTDRDMVVRAIAEGKNPASMKAREVMTAPVVSVREDATLEECTDLMEGNKIRRMPVVNATGAVIGIVAQADVARHASKKDAGELVRDVSAPNR